jgi:hypothetical protein
VHAFVNDLERRLGTYLYGRRMYETMVFWETASAEADEPPVFHDYAAIWRAAEKVVYSRTLECARSWSEAASAPCLTTYARNSSFSTSAGSQTASFTSTTAWAPDADPGDRRRLGPAGEWV